MNNAACKFLVALLVASLLLLPISGARARQQGQTAAPQAGQSSNQPVAVPVPAQSAPPPAPRPSRQQPLHASSDVVRIDVEVTDKSGKAVKGLKSDQFTITDNGKAQKISIFTYSDIESVETASTEEAKPIVVAVDSPVPVPQETLDSQIKDRRLLVLFFDLTSMQADDLQRAHDAALKFVQKLMTKADLVSVVVYSTKLSVWADFTNDHAKLEKAVARLTADASSELADNQYAAAQEGEYDVQRPFRASRGHS